jgi:predicted TIM-barrel fold metal-dependent hydrolase
MDRAGIDRACTFAPLIEGGVFEDHTYEKSNRAIAEAVRRYSDRLTGYARVNPHFGQQALGEMARCHDEYGLRGLKLHPDWEYFYANSRMIYPLLERCREYGWPAFFHTGYYPFSHPTLLYPVALDFPDVPIIMAHMGYRHTADCIIVARRCPNVYLETSANASQTAIHEAIRQAGARRVLFGSDMPYTDPDDVLGKVRTLPDLSEDDLALVLGGNMQRILAGGQPLP